MNSPVNSPVNRAVNRAVNSSETSDLCYSGLDSQGGAPTPPDLPISNDGYVCGGTDLNQGTVPFQRNRERGRRERERERKRRERGTGERERNRGERGRKGKRESAFVHSIAGRHD
jgi:hypothetical protein